MDIKAMFERIKSGEVAAHSELGTRDEAKQSKNFTARIQRLKTRTNIKAHAFVMKDVVIPFNPFTGEPDDTYNTKTPFRPILLVSQTLGQIKALCAEDPAMAAKWNEILGAEVDWSAPVSKEDYFLFKARNMIQPRIMSYSTVKLSFNGMCGFPEFANLYTVDPTQLDENNNYRPGINPLWNQAAVFFYSILKPEIEETVAELERKSASKEVIASQKSAIRSKSPVSFVTQTNLVPFIYMPFNEEPKAFDEKRPADFEPCLRWLKYNRDKWSSAMNDAMKDNLYDEDMNFFDFTIKTPSSQETKANGQVYTDDDGIELYKAMTITNTDSRHGGWSGNTQLEGKIVANQTLYAGMWAAAERYFLYSQEESMKEGGDTFEKLVAASSRFVPIESVMDKFLKACYQVFLSQFAESKYFTEERKMANSEFFLAMNPENAMAMAAADDDDIKAAAEAQQRDLHNILQTARDGDEDGDSSDSLNLSDLPVADT